MNCYGVILLLLVVAMAFEPEEKALMDRIRAVLNSHLVEGEKWNMTYHFYRPGLQKYGPYQWLWDSAFHMIAWSRLDVNNSILDLRTMLKKQERNNARVPEMIFWGKESLKDKIINKLLLSDTTVTDITQMPMLPFSLRRIYETTKDPKILKEFLIRVAEYHEWWAQERQPDHDGLVVIIHPWESGLDASPMYDEALMVSNPKPALMELYPNFEKLIVSYKYKFKWNQRKIIKKKQKPPHKKFIDYFVVKEVGVNAVYTAGWKILAELSLELENANMHEYCMKQYAIFTKGLISLWDQSKQRYVSKYLLKDEFKPTKANTVQSLFPILVPQIPEAHRQSILNALKDPKQYHCDYPIPSVAQSDPAFEPLFPYDLMWRGPTWAAPNYFVLEGLRQLNQNELYKQIGQKWVKAVLAKGIWEMWNPLTGEGYGVENLGMSTSVIDIMYRLQDMK